jgi:hypothetical protein
MLQALSRTSCPKGVRRESPEPVDLTTRPVSLARFNPRQKRVGDLDFVAGFELASPDKRLGGLSGLDELDDGRLLLVSDQGDFVWLSLAADGITPARAEIAGMRSVTGDPLWGKAEGDAEGLAVRGDLAFVSFERDHRVLAFDLGACGAAARGAPIASDGFSGALPEAFGRAGLVVEPNSGPEALAITTDAVLLAGLETQQDKAGPVSMRALEAAPDFDMQVGAGAPALVGMDVLPGDRDSLRVYSLHRGFDTVLGASIRVVETRFSPVAALPRKPGADASSVDAERKGRRYRVTGARTLATMDVLLNIDNFEGILARDMGGGRVRLVLVSDDNFSERQRTLFMVFDVRP